MLFSESILRTSAGLVLLFLGLSCCSHTPGSLKAAPAETHIPPSESEATEPDPALGSAGLSHEDLALPVDRFDPSWGHADAPVTILEFYDFECRFSKKANETLDELMETYGPDKLRIVSKNFPLAFRAKSPLAHDAAMAIRTLAGDGAFRRFKELAFENQEHIDPENLARWAEAVGASPEEMWGEIKTGRPTAKVIADQDLGRELGLTGTPSFFINGVPLHGAQARENFDALIERELKETRSLIESGASKKSLYELRLSENFKARKGAVGGAGRALESTSDGADSWKIPVDETDPIRGPRHAPVTIVMFSDFQCPFCSRVLPTLKRIEDEYGADVRFVWKDNPLPFHPQAEPAAQVARYIFDKKGAAAFWQAHDKLFLSQRQLDDPLFDTVLKEAGLSYFSYKKADHSQASQKISESQRLARDFDARGTPSFFINGHKFTGAQPFEKFKAVIDARLIVARAVLDGGVPLENIYDEMLQHASEAQAAPEPEKSVAPPPADTPHLGNRAAKMVVQEFADFQCPFSRRAESTVAEFLKNHQGEVVFYFRHLPLTFHKDAALAAEAAHEVFAQKGNSAFFRFRDLVFNTGGQGRAKVTRSELEAIAQSLGVNMSAFSNALDTRKHQKRVEADMDAAKAAGITGTPAFLIGGVTVSGAQPITKFESAFQQAKKAVGP